MFRSAAGEGAARPARDCPDRCPPLSAGVWNRPWQAGLTPKKLGIARGMHVAAVRRPPPCRRPRRRAGDRCRMPARTRSSIDCERADHHPHRRAQRVAANSPAMPSRRHLVVAGQRRAPNAAQARASPTGGGASAADEPGTAAAVADLVARRERTPGSAPSKAGVLARRAIARKPAMPGARSQVLVNQLVTGVDTTIARPPAPRSRPRPRCRMTCGRPPSRR